MKDIATRIGGPLLTLFLLAGCAEKVVVQNEFLDVNDCGYKRSTKVTKDGELTKSYTELLAVPEECRDNTHLALLIQHEFKDPAMQAITTSAVLNMISKKDAIFKESLLQVLGKYDISEEDLIERKEIDDAIQAAKREPGINCVEIDVGMFVCQ